MRLALKAGWSPARLSFTGPAKREAELQEAIAGGVGLLVIESLREARLADAIARAMHRVQPALVRIAPDSVPRGFGDTMAGRPSAFGIDLEDADAALAEITRLPGLRVAGLHIYSATQCLKVDPIAEIYRQYLAIFERLCVGHSIVPETLVLGSGLGVPYHDGDAPIDLTALAAAVLPSITAFRNAPRFRSVQLILELGRYLVSASGYFVTRVVSVKPSRGTRIAICDGGMNNHLPASGHFGMVMRRNYAMHRVQAAGEIVQPSEPVDIAGPLCTSLDRLASGIALPRLEEGDLVAVHNSGAYGLTASPIHFISHNAPREALVVEGALRDATRDFGVGGLIAAERERAPVVPASLAPPAPGPRRGLLLEPANGRALPPCANPTTAPPRGGRRRKGYAA
jgi:diaminopimelate decarboxylase